MSEWWLSRGDGKTEGPLSTQALVQGLVSGQVPNQSQVCRVGEQCWVRISQIDEIWEAANPEQIRTNVTERPWFLTAPEVGVPSGSSDVQPDDDRTQILTPLPVVTPAGVENRFVTPLPRPATHRELFARQGVALGLESPREASRPSDAPMRPKVPTLEGIAVTPQPPDADARALASGSSPTKSADFNEDHVEPAAVPEKPRQGLPARPLAAAAQPLGISPLGRAARATPGIAGIASLGRPPTSTHSAATLTYPQQPGRYGKPGLPPLSPGLDQQPNPPLPELRQTPKQLEGKLEVLATSETSASPAASTPSATAMRHPTRGRETPDAITAPRGSRRAESEAPPKPALPFSGTTAQTREARPTPVQSGHPLVPRKPQGDPSPPPATSPTQPDPSKGSASVFSNRAPNRSELKSSREGPAQRAATGETAGQRTDSRRASPGILSTPSALATRARASGSALPVAVRGEHPAVGVGSPAAQIQKTQHVASRAVSSEKAEPFPLAASGTPTVEDDHDEKTTLGNRPNDLPLRGVDGATTSTVNSSLPQSASSAPADEDGGEEETTIAHGPQAASASNSLAASSAFAPPQVAPVAQDTEDEESTAIVSPALLPHGSQTRVSPRPKPVPRSIRSDDEATTILRAPGAAKVPPQSKQPTSTSDATTAQPERGLGRSALGAAPPEPLVSDPSELMEECVDDDSSVPQRLGPMTLERRPIRAGAPANSHISRVAAAPPSAPPAARRPRFLSAPSIVLSPEPLTHQEATQPAARALRNSAAPRSPFGTVLMLFLALVLGALFVAYLYLTRR